MYRVFQALDELNAMIEDARSLPMTANCVVPRHESLLLLDDIRDSFPGELDDAQDVLDQRDSVLAEADATARDTVAAADTEADRTLRDARADADAMLADAKARADRMVAEATAHADGLVGDARAESAELLDRSRREAESTTGRARAESDRLVEQANIIYDRTITEARQEQQRMLSESEVVRIADEEARRIRDAAHAESDRRREECDAYIDDKMARFEEFLGSTIRTVSRGREELHGVTPAGRREAAGRRGSREGEPRGDGYGDY
ncbi:DivIVA domain-containing protein [Dietzia sp. PP-33]|uniref:DivIVA domain-containing protein n=1 Tax=Dietzia sp. PP-33 TaxID=2957500 RepID=UPI0029BCDC8A|nr:DivIVA domain-containing protein [Dietzia sp. PP-33]MDX2355654.1 DivIVA domain-containing protein [Dietzia sp. PP-33]